MQADKELVFKFILIGSSPVGKSSLLIKFCKDEYRENHVPTIGVDFMFKQLEFKGKAIKLQIWDTAGQEKFMTLGSSYYKGAHGILIVYDITNKQSFIEIAKWMEQLKHQTNPDMPKILIGNKSDLNGAREVTPEEGQEMANSLGMQFTETSAKEGFNVDHVFNTLLAEVFAHQEKQKKQEESQNQ